MTSSASLFSSPVETTPVRLADRVVEHLVEAILDGRLEPGAEMPPEGRIAAQFGVSKQVAREAVRQLAAIGLVHVQQGRISRVKELNSEPLDRFYALVVRNSEHRLREANEVRRVIETGTARLAAQRRDPSGLKLLEEAVQRMKIATSESSASFTEADVSFHQAIAATTGNRMLVLQMMGLRPVMEQVSAVLTLRSKRTKKDWQGTYDRHLLVFEAIRAGDVDATGRAIDNHFAAADIATVEIFHPTK